MTAMVLPDTVAAEDRGYFRERAAEERDAAALASCIVRDVHLELADLYAALSDDGVSTPELAGTA